MLRTAIGALALVVATAAFATTPDAVPDAYKDPLDVPATMLKRTLLSTQMQAVTRAGSRLVAVGVRGLVLISDDGGKQWTQASVPVAVDLTNVYFPTPKVGWAVGHAGVVLHSKDGGNTWEKQLDGRIAKKLLTEHFQALVDQGNAEAQRYLQDTNLNYTDGPEQALLGVWFKDERHGFVSGTFGTIFATSDGGKTWEPWVESVEGADFAPHYFAILGTQQGVLMASEKGVVYRLDAERKRFVPMPTGYAGTFFTLVETGDAVLAMGLRGTTYRLKGKDSKWEKVETGAKSSITASTPLPDGSALLTTLAGQLLTALDGGNRFRVVPVAQTMSYAGVAAGTPGTAVVVGSAGVRTIPLK